MRVLTLPFLLWAGLLLGGCATHVPLGPTVAGCDLPDTVPAGAVLGVREGRDTPTFPPSAPSGGTGCQRVWHGDRAQPQAMRVLATYLFEGGHVRRLVGTVPGGPDYDCRYRDGMLLTAESSNPAMCPAARDLERGR